MVKMKEILEKVERLVKLLPLEDKEMLKESKIKEDDKLNSAEFEVWDDDEGYLDIHIRLDPQIKRDD